MKITYEIYDNDLHRLCTPEEAYIDCDGQLWWRQIALSPDWHPYPKDAIWLTVKSATITRDDNPDSEKGIRSGDVGTETVPKNP